MKKIYATIALCALAIPTTLLAAQTPQSTAGEATLPEVVVTATRSSEAVNTIPAKVEVIDRQEIEETVSNTLTGQLKKNASIGVIEYPGALAGIGIRGFRPEFSGITKHSLILINGRPAGATNLATILTNNVERIEVLKGPASSLYGGEAMGGVINIITMKHTGKLTGSAELGYGSFDTNSQKVSLGGALNKRLDFDLSANRFDQAVDYRMGSGAVRAHTSYKTRNGSLRLGANLNKNWRLDTSASLYEGRNIETPGDIFNGNTKSGHKDINRYGLNLTVSGKVGSHHKLSLTTYKTNEKAENYKHYSGWFTVTQTAPYRSYDSETDWFGIQAKDEYSWHDNNNKIITGLDYQKINVELRSYTQDGSRNAPWAPNEGRKNLAGYVETVWRLLDRHLTLTTGGRYDTFDVETKATPYKTDFTPKTESFSTFSPRAGINYLFDNGVRLHSTVGKAFVPPTAAQLASYSKTVNYKGVTMITKGNPNINPENSTTYDLGMGYDLAKWGLSLDFTYFHTNVDDKIISVTTGNTTTYQNSLSATMAGLESMLSFDLGTAMNWDRSLTFFVNSTHMLKDEEEKTSGVMADTQNVAKYTINYGVKYDDGVFDGNLHFRTQGHMKDTNWNATGYPEVDYPSFTVVDLMAGMNFHEHNRISLKMSNIFNKDYYEKLGYPKPGRAVYVTYKYEF